MQQSKKGVFCLLLIDKGRRPKGKFFIYYESTKRKLKTIYICGCRCYERLQPNTKEFTRLSYTELIKEKSKKGEVFFCFFLEEEKKIFGNGEIVI